MNTGRTLALALVVSSSQAACTDRQAVLTRTTSPTSDASSPRPVPPLDAAAPSPTPRPEPAPETDPPPEPEPSPEPAPEPTDAAAPIPPTDVFAVAAGTSHSCAVVAGTLFCWGSNASGELGQGDAQDRNTPTAVSVDFGWLDVAAGASHSCGLSASRDVYCWGANDRGQLGQADRQSRSRPSLVALPSKTVQLASHFSHVCARTESNLTYCWGDNFEGELGQGDPFPATDDRAADGLSPLELPGDYQHISPGQGHTCGVRQDGSLWCWGRNTDFELAVAEPGQVRSPLRVGEETGWRSAHAGQAHSCALREPGTLWCWGENTSRDIQEGSPLGLSTSGPHLTPTPITDSDAWTEFSTNTFHSCGLRGAELWCWGRNIEGQLGTGDIDFRAEPTRIGDGFARVSVGRFHTCVLTRDNLVQCSGKNEAGELGTGDLERRRAFTTLRFE